MCSKNAFQQYTTCQYSEYVQFGSFWGILGVNYALIMQLKTSHATPSQLKYLFSQDVLKKCFPTVYYMPIFQICPIWIILGYFRGYLCINYATKI